MNTIQQARKEAGLSQAELANQAGVSRHSVLRLEQLCYPKPLPNIVDTLSDITGLSVDAINSGYIYDVRLNREYNGTVWFNDTASSVALVVAKAALNHVLEGASGGSHSHVFEVWRRAMCERIGQRSSQIQFCQMFSVHPSVLNRYETFKTSFPHALEEAFIDAGIKNTSQGRALLTLFKVSPSYNAVGD